MPGEFTERAFLNGKMDLTQAEAVIDMIRARPIWRCAPRREQLEGRLGVAIKTIRDELIALLGANRSLASIFPMKMSRRMKRARLTRAARFSRAED